MKSAPKLLVTKCIILLLPLSHKDLQGDENKYSLKTPPFKKIVI